MVTCLEQSKAGRQNSRHSRSCSHTGLRTFQRSKPLLKSPDGRVGKPRVNIPWLITGKTGCGLCSRGKYITAGSKNGLAMFALGSAFLAGPDGKRIKTVIIFKFWHQGILTMGAENHFWIIRHDWGQTQIRLTLWGNW